LAQIRTQNSKQPRPYAARAAVTSIFFLNGVGAGAWFARIPAVQQGLNLSAGELGAALLAVAVGALIAMPLIGWAVSRMGSRPVVTCAVLAFAGALALPPLAPSLPLLAAALLLYGIGAGSLDVSMNSQGVVVERRYGSPIMSSLHAAFSFGGMAGAALGGLAASRNIGPTPQLAVMAAVIAALGLGATRALLPASVDAGAADAGPAFARPSKALLGLGVIGFCALLSEGAMSDWSAVYLRQDLATGAGLAAAGYSVFSLTMALGRLAGDWLTARLGPVALTRGGGVLSAVGLGIALLVGHPAAALVGFACVGAGMATIFPLVLSAAGRAPQGAAGPAIAAVATMGYCGFLAGPPAIGFAASIATLAVGLGIVVLLGIVIAVLAPAAGAGANGQTVGISQPPPVGAASGGERDAAW
jgi:MFS family permease